MNVLCLDLTKLEFFFSNSLLKLFQWYLSIKIPSSVWVFIAQLGEHYSANAEATGSNPVEAPKVFFSGYFRNCLNCDSLRWSHTHFILLSLAIIATGWP